MMEEENSNKTEEVKIEEKNSKKEGKKGNKKLVFVLAIIIVLLAGATCYFAFVKGNNDEKESNNDNDEKKVMINYDELSNKVGRSNKNIMTVCDCSKVTSETDIDKASCTDYMSYNFDFATIIQKLKDAKDVKVLPTSTICSKYSFVSYDSEDNIIFNGFVSDDVKSILIGYNGEGYAFDYDQDLTSFFHSIVFASTKIDNKRVLSDDEITLLISKIKKYGLLELRNSDKKVFFKSNNVTNDMMNAMFNYVADLDNSFSDHWETGAVWSFKKAKADEYFKSVFGFIPKDYSDLICPVENEALLIYDKTNGTFTYNDEHPGHGGPATGFIDYKVTDSIKDNENYSIDVLFLRGNEMDGYYINDDEFNISLPDDEEENVSMYKKAFKNINPSKYTKYTFTFEKVNNNYVLMNIAPKK